MSNPLAFSIAFPAPTPPAYEKERGRYYRIVLSVIPILLYFLNITMASSARLYKINND